MQNVWKIKNPSCCEVHSNYYLLDGKKYSRVTSVLGVIAKHGLAAWYKKVGEKEANKVLETRQNIGIKTHKAFEMTLLGEEFDLDSYEEEIRKSIALFDIFKVKTNLKAYACEQKLWSDIYGFAGTADYIGIYTSCEDFLIRGHDTKFPNKSLVIVDWKTSRSIYKEAWLQLAAYTHAFFELTGVKVKGAVIAHFRDGKLKVDEKTYEELMKLFWVFKSTLTLYNWTHNIKFIEGEK